MDDYGSLRNCYHAFGQARPGRILSQTVRFIIIVIINSSSSSTDLSGFFYYQLISKAWNERLKLDSFSVFFDGFPSAFAVALWIILARPRTLFTGEISPLTTHLAPVYALVPLCGFRVHLRQQYNHSRCNGDGKLPKYEDIIIIIIIIVTFYHR